MRRLVSLLTAALVSALVSALAACAGGPAATPTETAGLFRDALFAAADEPVTTDDVFTVSEAMRAFLKHDIAEQLRTQGLQTGLVEALYAPHQLRIGYDTARTRNAAETFAARSGNCLSLVLMTAAFARELALPVHYGSAFLDETWSRDGDLLFASGHVNVTIGRRLFDSRTARDLPPLTIDFLPAEDIRRMQRRDIGENTVLAMYANNRAAEALARGGLDTGYAWARLALRHDPRFASAWNTLGVVYLRRGLAAAAAPVFEHVLAMDARNTRALSNLAESFARQDRAAEADAARRRLAALEPDPPFHFFRLGIDAMARHDYATARTHFAREVSRADYNHEFHFWLGVADWQLGDADAARRELTLAMTGSTTRRQHDLYAAKLAWLQSQHPPRESP